MSGETTKPNGGRELNVKETDDIETRMRKAGYGCHINYMEATFLDERVQTQGDGDTSSGNDGATAGNHTIVGENGSVSFVQKIPAIAQGPAAPLKDRKEKDKNKKPIPKDKEDKSREEK